MNRPLLCLTFCSLSLGSALGCSDATEARQIRLAVVNDSSGTARTANAEGYELTLTEARLVLRDFEFTTAGEQHTASLLRQVYDWLIPLASAHPGHFQGGTVIGEMPGRFVIDALAEHDLGEARLLVGAYEAANFGFAVAEPSETTDDDLLRGHTALLRGRAVKADASIEFLALLDAPAGRTLVGAPFRFEITDGAATPIRFRFLLLDPLEGDTLFDGIDFELLDEDRDGQVELSAASPPGPAQDAYFLLRRTFMTHDHYGLSLEANQ